MAQPWASVSADVDASVLPGTTAKGVGRLQGIRHGIWRAPVLQSGSLPRMVVLDQSPGETRLNYPPVSLGQGREEFLSRARDHSAIIGRTLVPTEARA